jgi:hypothetical protein
MRRMYTESVHLLVRTVGVLHLVVHRCDMLTGADALVTPVALALASAAGFSQLFSP